MHQGSTILHYLAISYVPEAADILGMLLDEHREQLDINAQDWDGHSALMRAACANDVRQIDGDDRDDNDDDDDR